MKQLGIETVGGRIRKVRNDKKKTIQAFSDMLGITGNYLGLVERGARNPSIELLQKISSTMNVPYDWLVGDATAQKAKDIHLKNSGECLDLIQAINPQLFLSIILMRAPNITRELLSTILMVPLETIDSILAGGPVDFDLRWSNAFPLLAQHMDLTSLRRDLHNLDVFLQHEEYSSRYLFLQRTLLPALQQEAVQEYGEVEASVSDAQQDDFQTLLSTHIIFKTKNTAAQVWHIFYYPYTDSIDNELVKELYDEQSTLFESYSSKVSIVFKSLDAYERMCSYYDDLDAQDDALLEIDQLPSHRPNISVMYFDEVAKKFEEFTSYFCGNEDGDF